MVGRNDPCPCGSGKKYKRCCLNKEKTYVESLGTANLATEMLNELKSKMGSTEYSSMEELQKLTSAFMEEQNTSPIDDFLGLSSSQMRGVLNTPFGSAEDIVSLSVFPELELISQTPVMEQTLYILNELGKNEKGIKATKTGNLPRSLVQSFYTDFAGEIREYPGKPMSQYDVMELDLLIFALKGMGLIKLRTNWISLTKKGQSMLDKNKYYDLYIKLFSFYTESLDWLSTTYYDEGFAIIQKALSFNLYILKKKAVEYTSETEIAELFQKAFPQAGDVSSPFVSLFLDDFCLYFGLVERDGKRTLLDLDNKLKYRQSPLFEKLFEWK